MMAVSEHRCEHGFMRSMVRCEACERRAKPLPLPIIDLPELEPVAALATIPPERTAVAWPGPADHVSAIDPQVVLRVAATAGFLTVAELLGRRRHRDVSRPRQVAYWLLRRLTQWSYPRISLAAQARPVVRSAAHPHFCDCDACLNGAAPGGAAHV